MQSNCRCDASTGIHEDPWADGSLQHPWGLTFGSGELDEFGYWQYPCQACARRHEIQDGMPIGTYWPFPEGDPRDGCETLGFLEVFHVG